MEAMRQLALTNLRLTLEAYADGALPEFDLFARSTVLMHFKRGDHVISPGGPITPHMWVVLRGISKLTVEVEGQGRTVEVFAEGDIMGTLGTIGTTTLSKVLQRGVHPRTEDMVEAMRSESTYRFTVTALEDSTALRVDYRIMDQLAYRHVEWARMLAALLTARLIHLHANLPDSQIGTPEGRVRRLTARHPALVARMSQREIANWIGINEVSLSRIMKRLREEERGATSRPKLTKVQSDDISPTTSAAG